MKKCIECGFKHVADAKKTYSELRMGYGQDASHVANFSADMSHAAQHLYELDADLANQLRDQRLMVMDQILSDVGELSFRPPFEEVEAKLFALMKEAIRNGKETATEGVSGNKDPKGARGAAKDRRSSNLRGR
jgi:hypothetical protein